MRCETLCTRIGLTFIVLGVGVFGMIGSSIWVGFQYSKRQSYTNSICNVTDVNNRAYRCCNKDASCKTCYVLDVIVQLDTSHYTTELAIIEPPYDTSELETMKKKIGRTYICYYNKKQWEKIDRHRRISTQPIGHYDDPPVILETLKVRWYRADTRTAWICLLISLGMCVYAPLVGIIFKLRDKYQRVQS